MKINSFYEYEKLASGFALYPGAGSGDTIALAYVALGLVGEGGEFSEKVKKLIRDGTFDKRLALLELSDVLWYLAACANELGSSLSDLAELNILKLTDRKERDVLLGSGDER